MGSRCSDLGRPVKMAPHTTQTSLSHTHTRTFMDPTVVILERGNFSVVFCLYMRHKSQTSGSHQQLQKFHMYCTLYCNWLYNTSLLMVDVTNFSHSEGIFNMYSVLQNLGVSKICILLKNHQESLYKIKNIITFETIIHVFHSGNRSVLRTKSLIRTDICTSLNKYRLLSQIYVPKFLTSLKKYYR